MRLEMTKVCMHSFNSKHVSKYATFAMGHQCAFHLFNDSSRFKLISANNVYELYYFDIKQIYFSTILLGF